MKDKDDRKLNCNHQYLQSNFKGMWECNNCHSKFFITEEDSLP